MWGCRLQLSLLNIPQNSQETDSTEVVIKLLRVNRVCLQSVTEKKNEIMMCPGCQPASIHSSQQPRQKLKVIRRLNNSIFHAAAHCVLPGLWLLSQFVFRFFPFVSRSFVQRGLEVRTRSRTGSARWVQDKRLLCHRSRPEKGCDELLSAFTPGQQYAGRWGGERSESESRPEGGRSMLSSHQDKDRKTGRLRESWESFVSPTSTTHLDVTKSCSVGMLGSFPHCDLRPLDTNLEGKVKMIFLDMLVSLWSPVPVPQSDTDGVLHLTWEVRIYKL